jgi:hypothetical protein
MQKKGAKRGRISSSTIQKRAINKFRKAHKNPYGGISQARKFINLIFASFPFRAHFGSEEPRKKSESGFKSIRC